MPSDRPPADPSSVGSVSSKPTPKERGCFQCSRRRIICDKTEPSCRKCIKKGITCSGVNRIRFTEGVARRGKLKDCKIPNISGDGVASLPMATTFPAVRWPDEKKRQKKAERAVKKRCKQPHSADRQGSTCISNVFPELPPIQLAASDLSRQMCPRHDLISGTEDDIEEIERVQDSMIRPYTTYNGLQPWIAPLSAEARMLFSYFSEAVAPVMVILDTAMNGYRELILPMALEDEILRRAVGVVAAQHLSREVPDMRHAAEAGRAAIISRLRKDALSSTPDQVFNKFTWATLIVLLVGETVTGSADYSFLVHMLLCLSANSRIDGQESSVTRFLQTQTNMFELLSLPLLGEHNGVLALQRSPKWQDWLTCEQFPEGTENHRIIEKTRLCYAAACDIYIRRATCEDTGFTTSTHFQDGQEESSTIRELIELLSRIPPEAPGGHALVWPCFVGGAEATDPIQRAFFVNYMDSVYARTKFRNIPVAIRSLENLWAGKGEKRWTQCLPELSHVLVM